jgi:non-lysosomal glucosylceramidase
MSGRQHKRVFPHTASQAAFLLGGLGTGNVSLGARGDLRDWELWNRPAKGLKVPYSFFAMSCSSGSGGSERGEARSARVLEAPVQPPYTQPHGFNTGSVAGLPHMTASELTAEYPFAWVTFRDAGFPAAVSLEAFSPFIPLNADDSGIPGVVLRYRARNRTRRPLRVTVAGSLANVVGFKGFDQFGNLLVEPGGTSSWREGAGFRGLHYSSTGLQPGSLEFGSMALVSTNRSVSCTESWLEGTWFDGVQDFWDRFSSSGRVSRAEAFAAPGSRIGLHADRPAVGSIGVEEVLGPGETGTFEFLLTWSFPNRPRGWRAPAEPASAAPVVKNYYARRFPDAWTAGSYLVENLARLEDLSRRFHRALYTSTLPPSVIDALGSNITVIRSPTCFRLEDGTFVSWEGCHDTEGCCEGSCTHVWNYAQTLAFLFPELERSMRRVEFNLETDDSGSMAFRTRRVFGLPRFDMLPAADGQLGAVIRLYRDWKLSGDDEFLRSVWAKAARTIDFAFASWDLDGDGVPDGQQHNTYDIEFYGPNPLTGAMFCAALKAGSLMAARVGDEKRCARFEEAFARGSQKLDALTWNGEYYVQRLEDMDAYRYQFSTGCLSDQLLGQLLAHVAGLGYILPRAHVRRAVRSVYRWNFLRDLRGHVNAQRTYALDAEGGLVLCTWPRGGRPRLPFVYSDEVWTGVEYQVAAHLVYEGYVKEGLQIVKAVRDRHDGVRRNPWDEVECGHHYVRSLSSWALLLALSGYRFDMVRKEISFQPAVHAANFSCFFSTGSAWGIYRQRTDPRTHRRRQEVEILYGSLDGVAVNRGNPENGS